MNAIKISSDKITLELSRDELGAFANALNEVCNGIEVPEFGTRMGIQLEEANAILESLALIYKKLDTLDSEIAE